MSERTAEPALLSRIDRLREAIDKAVDLLNTAWGGFGPNEQLEQGITTLQHARTADDIAQGHDWPPAISAPDTLSEKPGLDDAAELQATFDLRYDADMRAIKRWQAAHLGNELVWPDHADLVVWLLGRLEVLELARPLINHAIARMDAAAEVAALTEELPPYPGMTGALDLGDADFRDIYGALKAAHTASGSTDSEGR